VFAISSVVSCVISGLRFLEVTSLTNLSTSCKIGQAPKWVLSALFVIRSQRKLQNFIIFIYYSFRAFGN